MRYSYNDGEIAMAKTMGYDTVTYCWHCEKNVPVYCMDAVCKCGAPFDSSRCQEFKFYPKNRIGRKG